MKLNLKGYVFNVIATSILLSNSFAKESELPTIDIYRTNQLSEISIKKDFGNVIKQMSDLLYESKNPDSDVNMKKYADLHKKIISEIKKRGEFSYVGLSMIRYPEEHVAHLTIDIVDSNDKNRVYKFLPVPSKDVTDPANLIKNWESYEKIGFSIFFKENKFPTYKVCPAHHCMFGFDDRRFKKYGRMFNKLVPENKKQLIKILREDKNPQKRTSAAYLLAHTKDGKELISILMPSIYDSNSAVRNAVMRVMAETVSKNNITDISIGDILKALDFPETTDRNKALYVLARLVKQPKYATYVKKNALDLLMIELNLLQPNVHGLAYEILKEISGKNYSDLDYVSWQKWVNTQKIVKS